MTQRHEVSKHYWNKWYQINLFCARLPHTVNLLKKKKEKHPKTVSAKYNKVKWNKIRSASRTLGVGNVYMTFSSVTQLSPTLCDPMNRSTPGFPVHDQLLECTQNHVHRVSDAIQPSHPLSSPSPPAPNASQHQSLCQ